MKLLIADDNAVNLKLLRAQLEPEGHEVVGASNGVDALRLLREGRGADGVISDILMPEMDGYRFCIEVRKDAALCHLPFVLYTSTYNSPADRQLALNVGADAYISKPAPVGSILDALRAASGRKKSVVTAASARDGESGNLKKYSEVLVRKLEDKNLDLERSMVRLQEAHEEVRRADAQYRIVFENVPVGITMTGADGTIISANAVSARMLGYESVDAAMADLRNDSARVYVDAAVRQEYVHRLRADHVVRNFEVELLRKDGSRFWASLDGRQIVDAQGGPLLFVTIIDDITLQRAQEYRIARLSRVKEMHSRINAAVAHIKERQSLLDEVCRIAVSTGGLRAAWVAWRGREGKEIEPVASQGPMEYLLERIRNYSSREPDEPEGITPGVLRGGKSVVVNDTRSMPGVRLRQEKLEQNFLASMHLPLKIGGATEGVLVLYAAEAGYFDDEERHLLDELAADVSLALDALQKAERLEYLAYYDPLTGLPNRSLFHDRLAHGLRPREGGARVIAVALIDLARFRRINESLGRQVGDELLKAVGKRLLQHSDTAARIGVDLYGVVLRGLPSAEEVNRALEATIESCFSESFEIGGARQVASCRVGVALHPNDGADADTLLRNAEAALRRCKRAGENMMFYAPEMNAQVADALAIENKLRRAIEKREFVLHYQPKVEMEGRRIAGAEALIRWQDPDKGLVPPGHFIPVLEETGLIAEVGRWALQQTFADLNAWTKQGLRAPRIAVNVSAIQLQRKDFVDTVIAEIERGGDQPELLELEVTESLVMRNVEDSTRKLSILRGMGVTMAIDDFGTGYSSLAYLARLPLDKLKIDRSFVSAVATNVESTTLVTTMVGLAHGLKLKVVAEGVETEEQARMLTLFRCDEAQGYLFSKPVPAVEFAKLLAGKT